MKRTVLAVRGKSAVGKSTSIRQAFDELLLIPESKEIWRLPKGQVDLVAIVKVRGRLVGFASQGDWIRYLRPDLQKLIRAKCHVIVCATKSRGDTVKYVENLKLTYSVEWIEKLPATNQRIANKQTANRIVHRILSLVS